MSEVAQVWAPVAASLAGGAVVAGLAVRHPLRAAARALVAQPRATPAPDALLRTGGAAGVGVLAVLAATVLPVLPSGATPLSSPADLVWFNACEALLWVAWWCLGWGQNSVHALVGAYRFLAVGLAYELPLMFALITVGVGAGSLRVDDVVAVQADGVWFVLVMPVAAAAFVAGAAAFCAWGPFSAPVGGDLAGGVLVDLSGRDRLLARSGQAMFLAVSAIATATLFLGAGEGPWLPEPVWLALKATGVAALLVAAARYLPALPPARLMDVAWVVVLPATVLQALVVSVLVLRGAW